tara:strand:+ start:1722 stop:2339 length:618 start_codon:yes stop_codon:yes gene_type:complete
MFDKQIQDFLQKPLIIIGKQLIKFVTPNQITFFGLSMGIISTILIFFEIYNIALVFLILNRICDGLDGVMARLTKPTKKGAYLDIVFDFIFYSLFVLAFGLSNEKYLIFSMILLFCYVGTATTFLANSLLINVQNKIFQNETEEQNKLIKGFKYAYGIVEGTETIIFMILSLIFPKYFIFISLIFIALCIFTIFVRIYVCFKYYD